MEHDKDFETFCQKLKEYPSYFQLNLNKLNTRKWKHVVRKIISERAEISHTQCDLEIYRDLNLEAFAKFQLQTFGESENLINKVIDKSQNRNMNACAMMAMIKYRNGEFSESERYMQHLCQLDRCTRVVNESRAEIAFAFSRLGASYYEKAISIFEQVISENQEQVIWKYGLALLFRRCLRLSVRSMMSNMDTKSYYKRAEDIFQSIIDKYPCADDVLRLYVARSYIELANLYSMSDIDGGQVNRERIIKLTDKSIQIEPNNHIILCKAGILFLKFDNYDLARKYLEKATSIRRTCISCHHLGRVLRRQIEMRNVYDSNLSPRSINSNIHPSKEQASYHIPAIDLQPREVSQLDTHETYDFLVERISKSPQEIAIYPASATNELELCIKLFQEAVDISEGHNLEAQYDIGLTYLQLAEPRYELALDNFRKVFNNENSPFVVFESYEQSGLCLLHMSNNSRYSTDRTMDYKQNAKEMFKRAIRYWSMYQHTDQYCQSLISFRDLILGDGETDMNVKGMTDLAKLYSTVRKYGEALDLYEALWVKLRACEQDESCEVIQGVITNSIEVGRYAAALDMLAVFVLTKEGLKSKRFISDILIKTMEHAVDHSNRNIAKRVFAFHNPNYTDTTMDTIMIIFDEVGELSTHRGNLMGGWLKEFCKHGLSVTQNSDSVPPGRPKLSDTAELVADCKMVIFIVSNEQVTGEYQFMMNIALDSQCINPERRLSKILSVSIDSSPVPVPLRPCKSMTLLGDQDCDRKVFLKEVCKLYLEVS